MSKDSNEIIASIVSKWWGNAVCSCNRNDVRQITELCNCKEPELTATQIVNFEKQLYVYIYQQLECLDANSSIILGTDYAPCKPLADIANACSINLLRFPVKVTMEIGKDFCNVRARYDADLEYLYGTEDYFKRLVKSAEQNLIYWENKDENFFEKWSDYSKQHIIAEAKSAVIMARSLYSDYKSGKLKFGED